jgi:TPR repeat protein
MLSDKYNDIIQDFIDLQEFYPPLHDTQSDFPSVKAWLKHIRFSQFTETMMLKIMQYIFNLKRVEKYEEAAQLLLVCAATKDIFANYVLARELHIGELFTKNSSASFGLLMALEEERHPEAICDLAYFYKNGIATLQDLDKAKTYYTVASSLGVRRATESLKNF